ncbi:ATP-dependent zinc metalloprotease FTSH 4, mitochondrial [Stylosanthes scabra]|uniref:ATP-dependent zinc metalloprotease FTSH 4, mitochondrial n=1 Tax=Stylosanthes scabra TaxID=79078 RepID=A0ABU6YXY3_9FABA|nr:ATP-dependent zinc metalloprotease FTSH 4, mitochondrial [Stylosanthes scabra]
MAWRHLITQRVENGKIVKEFVLFASMDCSLSDYLDWRLLWYGVGLSRRLAVAKNQSELRLVKNLLGRSYLSVVKFEGRAGNRLFGAQGRFQSSYVGNLARRVREADEASEVAHLKELYRRNDPEAVIRAFESQPSLQTNPSALSEYIKALVKVDRLDESELLKTLRRGA